MEGDTKKGNLCPICLNVFSGQEIGVPESCDHCFCLVCIREWARNVNTCPVDRQVFELILIKNEIGGPVVLRVPVDKKSEDNDDDDLEDDDEPTFCEVCGRSDREDRLLLCDGCDAGYHLECLDPPLDTVPAGEWFCWECSPGEGQQPESSRDDEINFRVIPRTEQAERIRLRIARRLDLESSSDEDAEYSEVEVEEEEENDAEAEPQEIDSDDSGTRYMLADSEEKSSSAARRKSPTKRKSKKRKKVSGRRKSKGMRRKRRRRRRFPKRKCSRRSRTGGARTVGQIQKSMTVKERLASNLGMSPPDPGRFLPTLKRSKSGGSGPAVVGGLGFTPLYVFGDKNELLELDDEEEYDEDLVDDDPSALLSRNARQFNRPLKPSVGKPGIKRSRTERDSKPGELFPSPSTSGGDLLDSIFEDQTVLHASSKHIKICSDGSLEAKDSFWESQTKKEQKQQEKLEIVHQETPEEEEEEKEEAKTDPDSREQGSNEESNGEDLEVSSDIGNIQSPDSSSCIFKEKSDYFSENRSGPKTPSPQLCRNDFEAESEVDNSEFETAGRPPSAQPLVSSTSEDVGEVPQSQDNEESEEVFPAPGTPVPDSGVDDDDPGEESMDICGEEEMENANFEEEGFRNFGQTVPRQFCSAPVPPPPPVGQQAEMEQFSVEPYEPLMFHPPHFTKRAVLLPKPRGPPPNLTPQKPPGPPVNLAPQHEEIAEESSAEVGGDFEPFFEQQNQHSQERQKDDLQLMPPPASLGLPPFPTGHLPQGFPGMMPNVPNFEVGKEAIALNSTVAAIHHQQQQQQLTSANNSVGSFVPVDFSCGAGQRLISPTAEQINQQASFLASLAGIASSPAPPPLLGAGISLPPAPQLPNTSGPMVFPIQSPNMVALPQPVPSPQAVGTYSVPGLPGLLPGFHPVVFPPLPTGTPAVNFGQQPLILPRHIAPEIPLPPEPPLPAYAPVFPPPEPAEGPGEPDTLTVEQEIELVRAHFDTPTVQGPKPVSGRANSPLDSYSGSTPAGIGTQKSPVKPHEIDKASSNFEAADLPPELVTLMDQFAKMRKERGQQGRTKMESEVKEGRRLSPLLVKEEALEVRQQPKQKKQKLRFAESEEKSTSSKGTDSVSTAALAVKNSRAVKEESDFYEPTSAISPLSPDEDFFSSPLNSPELTVAVENDLEQRVSKLEKVSVEKVSLKSLEKRKKKEKKLQKLLMEATSTTGDDDMPSSATELQRKEKVKRKLADFSNENKLLEKFNYQLRVEDEVKQVLRPYYAKKKITKDEYKDVMRKAVPKITKKKGRFNPVKIKAFVEAYVENTIKGRGRKKKH